MIHMDDVQVYGNSSWDNNVAANWTFDYCDIMDIHDNITFDTFAFTNDATNSILNTLKMHDNILTATPTFTGAAGSFINLDIKNNIGYIAPGEIRSKKVALTAGAVNTFALAWQNPELQAVLIKEVLLDITTAGGTATAIIDVGSGADATTASNNLLNDIDLNAAAITVSTARNIKLDAKAGTTDYITGQILTEAASALVANIYIEYVGV